MTTTYHTAVSTGAVGNAATVETPLAALDAAIGLGGGGAAVTANVLIAWAEAEAYELTAITRDSDGVPTTATVKWPDASAGVFTTVTKDATWLAINAYTITHTTSGKTVTQAAVTRDANGDVTVKPALTVS